MSRTSKRNKKKNAEVQAAPQVKYYRTFLYIRLSEKDGGHGRRESIQIQKQICEDFVKKHPELLLQKTYTDNGVTGTTFARPAFEQLMEDVRAGKVDCIICKDFARFGRDALDAVDLIDVVFPSLGVRFISVLDDYDSENPACVQDRVNNILKHFMNDLYAREVSAKLVQAHRMSREKGEFWGARPPYGYQRSEESSKKLVPEENEKEIVRKIFDWYVFEGMSCHDIARKLNGMEIPSPEENYELRQNGKRKKERRVYWWAESISNLLKNPVYIGAAVYGKKRQMLCQNIPISLVPRDQWDIRENVWEPLIEKSVFEEAQKISMERWKDISQIWERNDDPDNKKIANGPLRGRIFCGECGRRLHRRKCNPGKYWYAYYSCKITQNVENVKCIKKVNEIYVMQAVHAALEYQIKLAAEFDRIYGMEFYKKLKSEAEYKIKAAKDRYEKFGGMLAQLFEHYAVGILDKSEYQMIKKEYLKDQEEAYEALNAVQNRYQGMLDRLRAKIDWAEQLVKCQGITEINREIVDLFIEKVVVRSAEEITVSFWFGDIFEEEMSETERGSSDAV